MVFFQSPEDVPLGQGAHIFAFAVEHRNGCVAVVLPFFQGLPQGKVIVDIHQVLLWGKEKQNVHHQLSYRKTNSAVVGAAPRLSDLILALFHSELKGIIILFRFYSQSFFALFQNMRKNHALWRILCYTKQKGTAHRASGTAALFSGYPLRRSKSGAMGYVRHRSCNFPLYTGPLKRYNKRVRFLSRFAGPNQII